VFPFLTTYRKWNTSHRKLIANMPQMRKAQRKAIIGTVEEFTSKASARRASEGIRATLNKETRSPRTMAE
jgi:hypothetical protein